ncbi:MAG: hypothetical protein ACLPKE_06355 [Streptosporangiaceae bacterium]
MLTETQDNEEIIARVAALDIGKAELVCCVRVPGEDRPGRRLQEVETYSTMTRSLGHGRPPALPGGVPGSVGQALINHARRAGAGLLVPKPTRDVVGLRLYSLADLL